MAAGSRDRPLMLAIGRYLQWRSRFLRYIDTRPNGDALRKCILNGPYIPITVIVQAVAATNDSSEVPEHTTVEPPMNMKCGKLSKGYNKPEWSRFVTIVKQQHKQDEVSYHELFDILKQYQKEVNELRAKRLARNANPLALFGNQRTMNVAGARENVGSLVVQQFGIQCFNCMEFGHFTKECRKPKRVKDSAYHKEKMLLCKQAEKAIRQRFRRLDLSTDSEPLEKVQNDIGYNVFANDLQHSEQSESISNTCIVETNDSNVIPDSSDMCEDDIWNDQNDVESDDERVALPNLIVNLKLDVDEKKIFKSN
nr:hypothetical protein [Tanacetum cinerariifolium]